MGKPERKEWIWAGGSKGAVVERSGLASARQTQHTARMSLQENPNAYACIMAGGSGERFWPMSRQRTPKHLLKLFSDRTLVEDTVRRLDGVVPRANVFVLTNEAQLAGTRAALVGLLAEANIIAEPAKRDTAPETRSRTSFRRAHSGSSG